MSGPDLHDRLVDVFARAHLPHDASARASLDRLIAVACERAGDDACADFPVRDDEIVGDPRRLVDDATQQLRILGFDAIRDAVPTAAIDRLPPLRPLD